MSKSWKRSKHWSDDERMSEKELRDRRKKSKKNRHRSEEPGEDPVEAHWQMLENLNRLNGRYRA